MASRPATQASDAAGRYTDEDERQHWGPLTPFILAVRQRRDTVPAAYPWSGLSALNPQPAPPAEMIFSAQLAMAIIAEFSAALAGAEWLGKAETGAASRRLSALIDDWCPTRSRPWPKPKSRPNAGPLPEPWQLIDSTPALFAASAVFGRAAEVAEGEAAEALAAAAVRLANAGHAAIR